MDNFFEERSAAYDHLAKRFLARKSILARILKSVVPEFSECTFEDIEKKYIEGEPILNVDKIPLDDTLDINGKNTESKSPTEGLVTFDIIFDAVAPITGEQIKLIINVEPQKTTKKIHYKLMKRAVYYAARLISSQKEKEFHGDYYNGLKKIYSIWICMDVQNYRADSIQEYRLTEKNIHGNFSDEPENYDLIRIIMLNLGEKNTTHNLLNLLHLIFMDLKSSEEKEKILRDEYDLEITRNMRKEMAEMGGLIEPLLNIGIKRGVEKAINEAKAKATAEAYKESEKNISLMNIRNLMKNLNLTLQQAMDALGIPADKQDELRPLI